MLAGIFAALAVAALLAAVYAPKALEIALLRLGIKKMPPAPEMRRGMSVPRRGASLPPVPSPSSTASGSTRGSGGPGAPSGGSISPSGRAAVKFGMTLRA